MLKGQDITEIQDQRGDEIEAAIEQAKEIAVKQKLLAPDGKPDWKQVYALMRPPPRGSLGAQGQSIASVASEQAGATSDGVTMNDKGEGRFVRNGNG